jgi:hypothetical protein
LADFVALALAAVSAAAVVFVNLRATSFPLESLLARGFYSDIGTSSVPL